MIFTGFLDSGDSLPMMMSVNKNTKLNISNLFFTQRLLFP